MKRIMVMLLLISLSVFFVGCNNREDSVFENPHPYLDNEFVRLIEEIPSTYSEDLVLPEPSSQEFEIVYEVDGIQLDDGVLPFDDNSNQVEIQLDIYITYQETTKYYYLPLLKQVEDSPSKEAELFFNQMYRRFMIEIPTVMTSNITLPQIDLNNATIDYDITCSTITRGRLVYTFPSENKNCDIEATIEYFEETTTFFRTIVMSSITELPQLPQVYINTNGQPIESKQVYVNGTLTLQTDGYTPYDTFEDESMQIRLRGNSTLLMPKKSYKVKFDEKIGFLQDYVEYDWVLLANFSDQTLVRNYLAYQMAAYFDMDVAPSYRFVDVHLNGVYQGNYLLTDQVEVTNDRVDIEEHSSDIDTGYLLEYDKGLFRDMEAAQEENYFTVDGIPFVIKSPKDDEPTYSNAQKIYISDYIDNLYSILQNKEDYTEYIDEQSFVDWFIINEVFKNVDAGYSSVFMYKDKDKKIHMGPVWDFDLSTGNPGHLDERGPEGWYVSLSYKNEFYFHLMQYPSFQQALKRRWNQMYDSAIKVLPELVLEAADSITYSQYQNFLTWDIIGKNDDWYTAPEILALDTYDKQVWFLYDYLTVRINWLDTEINKF